jgi:hypothetical protein
LEGRPVLGLVLGAADSALDAGVGAVTGFEVRQLPHLVWVRAA